MSGFLLHVRQIFVSSHPILITFTSTPSPYSIYILLLHLFNSTFFPLFYPYVILTLTALIATWVTYEETEIRYVNIVTRVHACVQTHSIVLLFSSTCVLSNTLLLQAHPSMHVSTQNVFTLVVVRSFNKLC